MALQWSSMELLYGFVLWAILVYLLATAIRLAGLVPESVSVVAVVSLLSVGSLALAVVVGVVWYLRDDAESVTSGEVF